MAKLPQSHTYMGMGAGSVGVFLRGTQLTVLRGNSAEVTGAPESGQGLSQFPRHWPSFQPEGKVRKEV